MTTPAAPCWPDFSPSTLALFLRARRLAHEELSPRKRPVADELVAVTGLPLSEIERAFAGRLKDAGKRATLWAALGHFPADFGIVLADTGHQFFASRVVSQARPADAPAGRASRDGRSTLRASPDERGGRSHG